MPLRNRRLKYAVALAGTQVACLAVGLWLHHHFVISQVDQAAEEQAFAEMADVADEVFQTVHRLDLSSDLAEFPGAEEVNRLLQASQTLPAIQLALTDAQWNVLAALPDRDTDSTAQTSPPETLAWNTPVDFSAGTAGPIRGLLSIGDERHAAFADPLPGRKGYAVVHYPLEQVGVNPAKATSTLWAVGVMTWVWTGTLLLIPIYLITARFYDELTSRQAQSETAALSNIRSLERTRDAVIFGLAKLAESRDDMTGRHLDRISAYAYRLSASVRHHPKYAHLITPEFLELISVSSALHDIGKVGIEDAILLKPGRLSAEERAQIEKHSAIGGQCLLEIERHLGGSNFLQMAREIAWHHHERWDGTGYPRGLAGEAIPLAARIVAIADVYDALASRRTYKEPLPHRECVALISEGTGTQFDPDLVEAFLKIEDSFRRIADQYGESVPRDAVPASDAAASTTDWESDALSTLEAMLREGQQAAERAPVTDRPDPVSNPVP